MSSGFFPRFSPFKVAILVTLRAGEKWNIVFRVVARASAAPLCACTNVQPAEETCRIRLARRTKARFLRLVCPGVELQCSVTPCHSAPRCLRLSSPAPCVRACGIYGRSIAHPPLMEPEIHPFSRILGRTVVNALFRVRALSASGTEHPLSLAVL